MPVSTWSGKRVTFRDTHSTIELESQTTLRYVLKGTFRVVEKGAWFTSGLASDTGGALQDGVGSTFRLDVRNKSAFPESVARPTAFSFLFSHTHHLFICVGDSPNCPEKSTGAVENKPIRAFEGTRDTLTDTKNKAQLAVGILIKKTGSTNTQRWPSNIVALR